MHKLNLTNFPSYQIWVTSSPPYLQILLFKKLIISDKPDDYMLFYVDLSRGENPFEFINFTKPGNNPEYQFFLDAKKNGDQPLMKFKVETVDRIFEVLENLK